MAGRRVLFLDCVSGISGDMLVGALLDLGWPENALRAGLKLPGLREEYSLSVTRQTRCGISGVKFDVIPAGGPGKKKRLQACSVPVGGHSHGRNFREIKKLIGSSSLPAAVRQRAISVFGRIAEAEGKIHGIPANRVNFHEVGAVDSIVDIVAACLGVFDLDVDKIAASSLFEGTGEIHAEHGCLPVPSPATLEILRGVPLRQIPEPMEFITPTGAALLAEYVEAFGLMPRMRPHRIGYGLGSRDPAHRPNILRAVLGTEDEECAASNDRIVEIQTNLDDMTPEMAGELAEHLLRAGALDVFTLPAQMKKSRPGILLVVLSIPDRAGELAATILEHSTAFGVRMHGCERMILRREIRLVRTPYGPIPVKLGFMAERLLQRTPEFSACREAAQNAGVPVREVYRAALEAAFQMAGKQARSRPKAG